MHNSSTMAATSSAHSRQNPLFFLAFVHLPNCTGNLTVTPYCNHNKSPWRPSRQQGLAFFSAYPPKIVAKSYVYQELN